MNRLPDPARFLTGYHFTPRLSFPNTLLLLALTPKTRNWERATRVVLATRQRSTEGKTKTQLQCYLGEQARPTPAPPGSSEVPLQVTQGCEPGGLMQQTGQEQGAILPSSRQSKAREAESCFRNRAWLITQAILSPQWRTSCQ